MEYDGGVIYSIVALIITTIIGPIITWFLARKKNAAEVDSNIIENMKESLDFYRQLSDDTRKRLDDALKRNDELEQKVNDLQKQVMTLSMMVAGYGLQDKLNSINGDVTIVNKDTVEPIEKSDE